MTDKNFLALDLEMNCPEGNFTPGKIIQVGVAISNLRNREFLKKSWFIDPGEDIFPRITELTGITTEDVKTKGTDHRTIYDEIKTLMETYEVFRQPIVWGGGDVPLMREEFEKELGNFEIFGHRDIDVKTLHTFNCLIKGRLSNTSLKSACAYYGLKFEGTPHRADDDATNTLNIFFNMLSKGIKTKQLLDELKKFS